MPSKSHRKIRHQMDRQKAIRQKDLGIRLMVLGPLLSYASLLFMNTGQLIMPVEIYAVLTFAGFAMVFVGSFFVERSFRTMLELTGGVPGPGSKPRTEPRTEPKPETTDAAGRR